MLAPIVLFVYNRPWHTAQTLIALSQNELAKESDLYIYADGAKENADAEQVFKIQEVRSIIRSQKWCRNVYFIESDTNKGLANSVIAGVTEIVNKFGKVIVLEDDLITSTAFLEYMNQALEYYKDSKSVFSISADLPPNDKLIIPADYKYDVFASLRNYSWGWASWADRWNQVDWNVNASHDIFTNKQLQAAFNRGGEDLTNMLHMHTNSQIDSWCIRFTLSHFIHHAVSILPCCSYVKNIGFDGSGVHCLGSENNLHAKERTNIDLLSKNREPNFLPYIYEDKRIINQFYSYFLPQKRPLWQKMINRAFQLFGMKRVFITKKSVFNV